MQFVLDSSLAMSWAFEDERTPERLQLLDALATGQVEALVPSLWYFEIANVLLVAERRGRLSVEQSEAFIELLVGLPIHATGVAGPESLHPLLLRARERGLTVYDAAYLEIAELAGKLPLATLDVKLATAAKASGIPSLAELLFALA